MMRSTLKRFVLAATFLSGCIAVLAQPVIDTKLLEWRNNDIVSLLSEGETLDLGSFEVNTLNREETRAFFNSIYMTSENVDMGWTGDYFNLDNTVTAAGDISENFKLATLLRINYFRAMCGLPADIILDPELNANCQLAALIMSGNDSLSHFPQTDLFPNYLTIIGDETAGKSNIAIGSSGPDSIVGYMRDKGASNYKAGHRRWILYPPAYKMGTGDVPGGTAPDSIITEITNFLGAAPNNDVLRSANSLQVITDFNSTRPVTSWPFVSYPAPGYAPYQVVYPRWSFSIEDADFSGATVTMTRNGETVAVVLEDEAFNIGDNTLVWVYDNQNSNDSISHTQPSEDTEYIVTVSNIANAPQSEYIYTVTVFDPATIGDDFVPTSISGATEPLIGIGNNYSIQSPGNWVDNFKWRSFTLENETNVWDAENEDLNATFVTDDGYDVTQSEVVNNGANSYHFIQIDFNNQYLEIDTEFVATESSSIGFNSRIRAMTDEQFAEVQISLDNGISWQTIDSQQGLGSGGESDFSQRSIDLSDYQGFSFHIRFGLLLKGNSAFIGTNPHSLEGWFFDDITFTNVFKVENAIESEISENTNFSFAPSGSATVALQAQGIIFDEYGIERGPVFIVNPVSGTNAAPIAVDDAAEIDEGVINTSGNVLDNDTDSDTDAQLSVATVANLETNVGTAITTTYGTISVQSDGNFVYTLDASNTDVQGLNDGQTLADIIQYSITDTHETASAELTITINGKTDVIPFGQLINISTRGKVQTGDSIMIGGFVIEGNDDLTVLVQGVAEELSGLDESSLLADPFISIVNEAGDVLHSNNDWESDDAELKAQTMTRIGATELQTGSKSAALLETLSPGIYTVFLYGVQEAEGIALIEVYDATEGNDTDSELINISTRGDVGIESDVMIGGFVIEGNTSKNVLIQGVGQELVGIDSEKLLSDPVIFLVNSENEIIASNDDWEVENKEVKAAVADSLGSTTLVSDSTSAALYLELEPGIYTVILSGIEGATGIALIEAYIAD
ncbi:VCBS domain-containing protein [Puniceicoccaceae bacterium K14]|nr:VCBS domain-containing protein [Puniceicoccaceae bacterium K14]